MTTIAAVRVPDAIVVACDTMAADNTGRVWPVRSKLLELDGTVIGHAGHRMVAPIIQGIGPPAWSHTGGDRDRAARVWVEQLADAMRDRHVPACDDGLVDAAQLVAYDGSLYYCTDGLAEPLDADVIAIGSGGDICLGYLESWRESGRLRDRLVAAHALTLALGAAACHDTGTGPGQYLVELPTTPAPDRGDAPTS